MFSRPYTTLSRKTIEAADCKMNYQHLNGHLTIFIEPLDPVLPMGNHDPLLGQRTTNNTRTQDSIPDKDMIHKTIHNLQLLMHITIQCLQTVPTDHHNFPLKL